MLFHKHERYLFAIFYLGIVLWNFLENYDFSLGYLKALFDYMEKGLVTGSQRVAYCMSVSLNPFLKSNV